MINFGIIRSFLERATYAHPRFNRLMKELRFWIWFLLVRLRSNVDLDINKTIWVNPKKIERVALELNPSLNMGRVIGGEWDRSEKRFEDLDVYQSFIQRFIHGNEWNTTNFYKRILGELQKGRIIWRCRAKSELDERLKKIDHLYQKIKTHGYKSGKERKKDESLTFYDPMQPEDEVTVNIGREGDLLFNNGRHRLAIAKILNIPKIRVKVVARHPEWMKLRKELIELARKYGGKLYQPLTHPDLQDIPSFYGSFRFDLIKKNLSIEKGKVLDIGAQLGYFCHRFEDEGFDCYAVENDPIFVFFLKKLKEAEKKKFKIIAQSLFDYNQGSNLSFDIVLALNVFHHFLKTIESYEKLIVLLKSIKAKEMYFQSHKYDEPQMKNVYKNFHPEEFAIFISKYTNFKYKIIGKTKDDRKIYKFFQSGGVE